MFSCIDKPEEEHKNQAENENDSPLFKVPVKESSFFQSIPKVMNSLFSNSMSSLQNEKTSENRFDSPIFTIIDKPKEKVSPLFGKSKSAIFSNEQEWEIKLNNLEQQINQRLAEVKNENSSFNAIKNKNETIPKELESIYTNFTILTSAMKSVFINLQLRNSSTLDNRKRKIKEFDLQKLKNEIKELKENKKKIYYISPKISVPQDLAELFVKNFEKMQLKIENFENSIILLKKFFKKVDPFCDNIDKKNQPRNLKMIKDKSKESDESGNISNLKKKTCVTFIQKMAEHIIITEELEKKLKKIKKTNCYDLNINDEEEEEKENYLNQSFSCSKKSDDEIHELTLDSIDIESSLNEKLKKVVLLKQMKPMEMLENFVQKSLRVKSFKVINKKNRKSDIFSFIDMEKELEL